MTDQKLTASFGRFTLRVGLEHCQFSVVYENNNCEVGGFISGTREGEFSKMSKDVKFNAQLRRITNN